MLVKKGPQVSSHYTSQYLLIIIEPYKNTLSEILIETHAFSLNNIVFENIFHEIGVICPGANMLSTEKVSICDRQLIMHKITSKLDIYIYI